MNATTEITIAVSESKGPIPPRVHRFEDGEAVQTVGWGTKCPGCGKFPIAGESITKILGTWWHAQCGAKHLRVMAADQAWIALGQQLERAPSRFSNPETQAIVRNLLRIAGQYVDLPGDSDDGEPEAVSPPRLRAVGGDPR